MESIEQIFNDKTIKPKDKTLSLAKLLEEKKVSAHELISFAKNSKDPVKASCIEALEFVTKTRPEFADLECLKFLSGTLAEKAPRIKWESAKTIANICHLFPDNLDTTIGNLFSNTEHAGTVVRWSSAQALVAIAKLNHKRNKELLLAMEAVSKREEKNSIVKIYSTVLKK